MTADLIFQNVTAYNVTKFDVLIGQLFTVSLSPDAVGVARWFADNDNVLDIEVTDSGAAANVKANATGPCEIQIQVDGAKVLTLYAEVYSPEAATLGLSAGTAQPK